MKRYFGSFAIFIILGLLVTSTISELRTKDYIHVYVKFTTATNQDIRLFYDNNGTGFTENKSVTGTILGSNKLQFKIPDIDSLQSLRLDLGNIPDQSFELKGIYLKSINITDHFKSSNQIEMDVDSGGIRVVTTGIDPFLVSDNISEKFKLLTKKESLFTWVFGSLLAFGITLAIHIMNLGRFVSLRLLRNEEYISLLVFCCLISLPLIVMLINPKEVTTAEKRALAPAPKLQITNLQKFQQEFDQYFNDHFGFRQSLVSMNTSLRYKLKVSSNPNVLIGKQGWLFYTAEKSMDDYQGEVRFTEEELARITRNLKERQDWLSNKGIYSLFLVGPNKQSVYSEYLPERIYGQPTRLDQLMAYFKKNADINMIDLRQKIKSHKDELPSYYATDTHWNDYGGYLAYEEVMSQLRNHFPGLKAHNLSDFKITSKSENLQLDLSGMLSIKEKDTIVTLEPYFERKTTVQQSDYYQTIVQSDTEKNNILVMFRDSFGTAMIPYLSDHFSKSIYITDYHLRDDIIDHEKPNIVIFEIVERNIPNFLNDNSEVVKNGQLANKSKNP